MLNLVGDVPVHPGLVALQIVQYDVPVLHLPPQQVEHNWLTILVRVLRRQRLHQCSVEKRHDEVVVVVAIDQSMWIVNQPVHHILIREYHSRCGIILDVHQYLLNHLVGQDVVAGVANQILWVHREQVHQALYLLGEEPIRVLDVLQIVGQHLALLQELRNLAGVHIHDIARIVHDVVCEYCAEIVRYLRNQRPYPLLALVLPFLVLNVVPQKGSELKLVRKGEIGLV